MIALCKYIKEVSTREGKEQFKLKEECWLKNKWVLTDYEQIQAGNQKQVSNYSKREILELPSNTSAF